MDKILGIYEPVSAELTNDEMKLSVWNRTYSFDKRSIMPASIKSGSRELLVAPATLYAEVNNKSKKFEDAYFNYTDSDDGESCTAVTATAAGSLVVNATHKVEFDGCTTVDLTIMPRGRSVKQVFHLEGNENEVLNLNKLYLDIPLSKEHIKYYQIFPTNGDHRISGKQVKMEDDMLHSAGLIPEGGMNFPFKEQIYLCGEKAGIGFFFRDAEGWGYEDSNKMAELIEEDDRYVLRFHIFDSEPKSWIYKCENDRKWTDLDPITLRFGMQVTPIRPAPPEMPLERCLQFDCFKRIEGNHDDYLRGPVPEGSDEIGFDRLKRLGVETLYIHEKWNDIQNSFILTASTKKRLRFIIDECHKRGIKVIPYFGYELSTLSPLYRELKGMCHVTKYGLENQWNWYRTPEQRDIYICSGSGWLDIFYEGLKKLIEEYNFDGFYFDGTAAPAGCACREHSCGFEGVTGEFEESYPVFEIREFLKKIYKLVRSRGGNMNLHFSGCHNLAALGLCDSIWEGEYFQMPLLHGELEVMPEDMLRAQYDYHNIGTLIQALCYSNPPEWSFKSAIGMMLLHGCIPKPNDIEYQLEIMSDIWKLYDGFRSDDVKWKPYYNSSGRVTCDNPDIRVSCYEKEDAILAIVATTHKGFNDTVEIKSALPTIKSYEGELLSKNGIAQIELNGFDFKFLILEK